MKRDSNGSPAKKVAAKNPRRSSDPNVLAHQLIGEMTERMEGPKATKDELSRVMSILGRRGGRIGGKARAEQLSPKRRSEIASAAAKKRWEQPSK